MGQCAPLHAGAGWHAALFLTPEGYVPERYIQAEKRGTEVDDGKPAVNHPVQAALIRIPANEYNCRLNFFARYMIYSRYNCLWKSLSICSIIKSGLLSRKDIYNSDKNEKFNAANVEMYEIITKFDKNSY